ncbi:hypothetical protein Agub_g5774, partial [Astrephomene gubernaculifera]
MLQQGRDLQRCRAHKTRSGRTRAAFGSCYTLSYPRTHCHAFGTRRCRTTVHAKDQQSEGAQEWDLVEKMVSFFFPKALSDPAPMGLKRINFEELPDQYCELTRRAAPLADDEADPLVVLLRPLLAATQLEALPLRCVYDADRDGWSAAAFHAKVDGLGAAVVVAGSE